MKRIDLIFFSSDTGLAGAFNSNLLKASQKFFQDHAGGRGYADSGRPQRRATFIAAATAKILSEHMNLAARPTYQDAAEIAREVIRRYRDGETDAVFVLNNEFKSVMSQKLSVMQLLPVDRRH